MYNTNLDQIGVLLYKLQRNFGVPIVFKKFVDTHNDVTTGKQIQIYDEYKIRRAICMPFSHSRNYQFDRVFSSANKNFTYGAFFDKSTTLFIILKRDLAILPVLEDVIVKDGQIYQFGSVDLMDGNAGYAIKATGARAAVTNE